MRWFDVDIEQRNLNRTSYWAVHNMIWPHIYAKSLLISDQIECLELKVLDSQWRKLLFPATIKINRKHYLEYQLKVTATPDEIDRMTPVPKPDKIIVEKQPPAEYPPLGVPSRKLIYYAAKRYGIDARYFQHDIEWELAGLVCCPYSVEDMEKLEKLCDRCPDVPDI
jgi:hypothetical protein